MKYLPFFVVLLILFESCEEDRPLLKDDSLKSDSIYANALTDSVEHYFKAEKPTPELYSDSIVALMSNELSPKVSAYYINQLGLLFFSQSDYFTAEKYFRLSADAYVKAGDSSGMAEQISNIGVVNEVTGRFDKAVENYLEALSIFKKLDNKTAASNIYNNLGIVNKMTGNYEQAVSCYKQVISTQGVDDMGASALNNIAVVFEAQQRYDSALLYYKSAFEKYILLGDVEHQAVVTNNIGNIYLMRNDYVKARIMFNKALRMHRDKGSPMGELHVLRNLGKLALAENRLSEARSYLELCEEQSKNNPFTDYRRQIAGLLAELYEKQKLYEKAVYKLKEYNCLNDSILRKENTEAVNRLQAKYNLREKADQIEILHLNSKVQEKRITVQWLLIGIMTVLFFLGLIIFALVQKRKNEQIEQMQNNIHEYLSQLDVLKQITGEKKELSKEILADRLKQFQLTEREIDVLMQIRKGHKNDEIAENLFVSVNTVKTHTKNLFLKLDVRNRIEALRRSGIL